MHDDVLGYQCNECGSFRIRFIRPHDQGLYETDTLVCRDCGVGGNEQAFKARDTQGVIEVGDHVRLSYAKQFGFVRQRGSVGKGLGEVKGFLVWCGGADDNVVFFPEDDTILLWKKEEMQDG